MSKLGGETKMDPAERWVDEEKGVSLSGKRFHKLKVKNHVWDRAVLSRVGRCGVWGRRRQESGYSSHRGSVSSSSLRGGSLSPRCGEIMSLPSRVSGCVCHTCLELNLLISLRLPYFVSSVPPPATGRPRPWRGTAGGAGSG